MFCSHFDLLLWLSVFVDLMLMTLLMLLGIWLILLHAVIFLYVVCCC